MNEGPSHSMRSVKVDPNRTPFRAGFVAIVGRPNVGKSTLLNELLKLKLSAASSKPQTTRYSIMGIRHAEKSQAVFLDTPGRLSRPRDELDRRMLHDSGTAIDQADVAVLVVEPRAPGDTERWLAQAIAERKCPAILAVNKIDTVRNKASLLPVMDAYRALHPFQELVPISAAGDDGLERLADLIVQQLPVSEPLFPADRFTDRSEQFLVAEIVREKVYRLYGDELPRSTAVGIDEFQRDSPDHGGKLYVRALVYLEREGQKAIIIGRNGQALKNVGVQARADIEALLEAPVHLELWVKVRPKWRDKPGFLETLGF